MIKLREQSHYTLQSILANVVDYSCSDNNIVMQLADENNLDFINKPENKKDLEDVLKSIGDYTLTFTYNTKSVKKNIVEILKEKFNNIIIKE